MKGDPMPQPDLELIDTRDLIDEIFRRFDGAVFCGIRDASKTDWFSDTKIQGNAIACLAAAAMLQAKVAGKVAKEVGK